MGSCIDECILLDVQSCICPWWSAHYRRHKHHHHAYAYLKCVHARSHNKFYFTSFPKKPHHSLSQHGRLQSSAHHPVPLPASLNLLLLNFDQLATTPLPEQFPERSANSDERRKLPTQHLHQRGTATKAPATTCRSESQSLLTSLSLGASAGETPHREIWRREGGYEILTQRAILSRSDLGCLTCAAV